jgi:hypothetical protein
MRDQVLSVKVEIDTNPPAGANLSTKIIRRHYLLNLHHYDRSSLLAGKLHAVLARQYTKGRDIYDLLWYLSDPDWPAPNLTMLNNALKQTGWPDDPLNKQNWRTAVAGRLSSVDWRQVREDVSPFLERKQEEEMLTAETFSSLLAV